MRYFAEIHIMIIIITVWCMNSVSHTAEKQICEMLEYYKRLLQKSKDELGVLTEEVDMIHQKLKIAQSWYVCC